MEKVKVVIRRLIARYFSSIVEIFYRLKFRFLNFDLNSPVIILTPGKVGSSSVYLTLKNKIENPVFHLHRFSKFGIEESVKEHMTSDRKSKPLHLIISKLLREKLKKYDGPIYIITIIREPVARAVSAFFQNTEFFKDTLEKDGIKIDDQKSLEMLSEKLDYQIIKELEKWFNEEIRCNFGINVLEEPFDVSKGYMIKKIKNVQFLLLQMESIDAIFPQAVKGFLDLPNEIKLERANVGSEKHYSESYQDVKQKISVSQKELDKIINSRFFQKFYQDLTASVIQKWAQSAEKNTRPNLR